MSSILDRDSAAGMPQESEPGGVQQVESL